MKKRVPKKVSVKKTKVKADMSVSELANMVARGFVDVEKRIGDRIDSVETSLNSKIDSVEEHLSGRINILDNKVDRLQDSVNDLSYETKKTRVRVENLEFKVFGAIQEA